MRLPFGTTGKNEVLLVVESFGNGRMLTIRNASEQEESATLLHNDKIVKMTNISIDFSSVGLSFVADVPFRRELLSCYVEGLTLEYLTNPDNSSCDFKIKVIF